MISMDDPPERVMPAARVDKAAGFGGESRLDLFLVSQGFGFVLERTVEQTVFTGSLRRHDAPAEMIAIPNLTTLLGWSRQG